MNRLRSLAVLLVLTALVIGVPSDRLAACSWGDTVPIFVNSVFPDDAAAYARGEIGIVHPTFARRHLVQAYRRLSGLPAGEVPELMSAYQPDADRNDEVERWLEAREAIVKTGRRLKSYEVATYRSVRQYESFRNCTETPFANATATLQARVQRFGAASAEVKEWIRGQDVVFENCGPREGVALPPALAAGADPLLVADRTYQTAAAHFYATEYEKAEGLFRAIAGDARSPWRRFGRYLAARALIRRATVLARSGDALDAALLTRAETELKAIAADAALREMQAAAASLLGYVTTRLRPVDRLHEVSARLKAGDAIAPQDIVDYSWLMDRFLGDTVQYTYDSIKDRDALVRGDDLTDWVLALQGGGLARAIERWKSTRAETWLIAVLWHIDPRHADVPAALAAAEAVPRSSAAFATSAFLRVRLLAARGDHDGARRVLLTLPAAPAPGFPQATVNLLAAERFMLATSFEDLLRHAPRTPVQEGSRLIEATELIKKDLHLDQDAVLVLSERLPLARLIEAATSSILPRPMRLAIAGAALTRAIVLGRDEVGRAAADLWRTLEPSTATYLAAYINAADSQSRRYAGILLLLRSPHLHAYVTSSADATTLTDREINHQGGNWWCPAAVSSSGISGMYQDSALSVLPHLTYLRSAPDFPEFLSDAERAAAASELEALAKTGTAPNYLADQAVQWARAQPKDTRAAEALARSVEGTRWGCTDGATGTYSRRAFQTLHRLFPGSAWAKRTKYWYGPS